MRARSSQEPLHVVHAALTWQRLANFKMLSTSDFNFLSSGVIAICQQKYRAFGSLKQCYESESRNNLKVRVAVAIIVSVFRVDVGIRWLPETHTSSCPVPVD